MSLLLINLYEGGHEIMEKFNNQRVVIVIKNDH